MYLYVFFWEITPKYTRTLSLPSWPKPSVIFHWQHETFGTPTLKLAYPRAAHRPTVHCGLKLWGKHFLEREIRGSQFAWDDHHRHRHLRGVNILCRVPLLKCETRRILMRRFFLLKEGSASKTWTNAQQAKHFGLNPDGYAVLVKLILIDDCF